MHQQSWSIGELAAETGLTIRALRHFEDKGLLGAVARSAAGQRRYGRDEVERLYQVIALRALGVPLAQIAVVLDSPSALTQVLTNQLAHVDEQLAALGALRALLHKVIETGSAVSVEELIKVVRHTVVSQELVDEYLDENDQQVLSDRAVELGGEASRIVHVDYPRLYRAALANLTRGVQPDAPAMQKIAGELESLAEQLSGGSPAPGQKVQRMWKERSKDITGRDWTDLSEYVMAAREHYRAAREAAD